MTQPAPEAIDWAILCLREQLGPDVAIVEIEPMPSRLSSVERLTVRAGAERRRFYLKRCNPAAIAGTFREHAAHLTAIATAIRAAGLMGLDLVGMDLDRAWLLTAEVPGEPLTGRTIVARLRPAGWQGLVNAWRGVGVWLNALHWRTGQPEQRESHAAVLAAYASLRLDAWAAEDPSETGLVESSIEAVRAAALRASRTMTVTPCHGDVTGGNILVGPRGVALIDFDDVRMDAPGIDVSQVWLEIDESSRLAGALPLPGLTGRARAAFRAAYGSRFPAGADFWLPHMCNLSVIALTLARQRRLDRPRFNSRYGRTRRLIRAAIEGLSTGEPPG